MALSWSALLAKAVFPAIGGKGRGNGAGNGGNDKAQINHNVIIWRPVAGPPLPARVATVATLPAAVAEPLPEPLPMVTVAATVPATVARVDRPAGNGASKVSPAAAARLFAAEMIEAGAYTLKWSRVAHNYKLMAAHYGWPQLTEKTLSIELARLGCSKRVQRLKDGTRPTVLTFPIKLKGPKT